MTVRWMCLFVFCFLFAGWTTSCTDTVETTILLPKIVEPWWKIAGNPDLGRLTDPGQQPVDFGVWQADDGRWQLWSCIRYTKSEGWTRLLYWWEGSGLEQPDWNPIGIAMEADPAHEELIGGLQAPFVLRFEDLYYMFYGSGFYIALATSRDGKAFQREAMAHGSGMFAEPMGIHEPRSGTYVPTHARDPMVLQGGDLFYCYYTAHPEVDGDNTKNNKESVYLRTSVDLREWSDSVQVRHGGSAGNTSGTAECPFVVYHEESDYYYLFTTQVYADEPETRVYRSRDPAYFGIDEDEGFLVGELPVAAPEIIRHGDQWYVAALLPDLQGIRMARLQWVEGGGKTAE